MCMYVYFCVRVRVRVSKVGVCVCVCVCRWMHERVRKNYYACAGCSRAVYGCLSTLTDMCLAAASVFIIHVCANCKR